MTITKEEMEAAIEKATSGLKTKNEELLAKLKEAKDSKAELESKVKEVEDAREEAERQAALKNGDVEKITKQLETKFTKTIEELNSKLSGSSARLNEVLIDSALTEALIKVNVAPQYLEMAKDTIKAKNKPEIGDVDGKSSGLIDGKPITEFVAAWSQGDTGKHIIAAPANGGGGSHGQNSGGKVSTEKADMGGSKAERTAAIAQKFPNLSDK
ncbi:hypothetical protein [Dyadobacter sp. CY356]|uniref:hypothetical protein n=1 Tax=Dyadobacter sp. CY356 TaxID=2906442 RepID=UPI001F1ACDF0|nr:hypothetical protein [Dyadobacter sp. CY356]MCF0055521.1 hypothetical protein [Dyadobacter sp. CY356]